jgi:hypothetical protein
MFNLFQRKRHKKNWRSTSEMDLYELSEQETDMLMGGSPVRSLIGGENKPSYWQNSSPRNFDGTGYQPFPAMYPQNTWSQSPSWLQQLGNDPALSRQSTYPPYS